MGLGLIVNNFIFLNLLPTLMLDTAYNIFTSCLQWESHCQFLFKLKITFFIIIILSSLHKEMFY